MNQTLRWLRLLADPDKRQASTVYDLLSTENNLGEQSLYLNLGYWDGARTYDEACQALAKVLGDAAGLKAGDEVLDCGFGFGDQDLFWAEAYAPRRIVGLNITASQVETARRRVAGRGLEGRIDLRHGSATAVPRDAGTFDKVLALETAFHYVTREAFFSEAYRVLKPGGRLATADIVPLAGAPNGLFDRVGQYFGRSFWQIPKENLYTAEEYQRKLRAVGFAGVRAVSIRESVYAPFNAYARARLDEPSVARRMHPLVRAFWKATARDERGWSGLDYILVTADKPAEASA